MNRVQQIEREIAELSNRIYQLKIELEKIRKTCAHEFLEDRYTQTCIKCNLAQSLYY
ncbi:hypothetical protein [Effusibacillus pohliae]|uniref:hypothetical protein n=1 Tax=Effusibacillus pohliae TaxID=232270 RepID=UPI0003601116|nr:hypothetical protein [Effusibacillus pohliae]